MRIEIILLLCSIFVLSGCEESKGDEVPEQKNKNLSFQCEQKIPEFTLGPNSDPSKEELDKLCGCIWSNLDGWEKSTSIAITEGREKDVSALHMRAFPSRFGKIMQDCGAMKL